MTANYGEPVDGYGCLLPFDSDHPEFARGFEAGRLWALLRAFPDEEVVEYVHASNVEMFMRMGEATGRRVSGEELDERWVAVTFAPCGLHEPAVPSED